jgi:hypothetical protein
MTVADTTATTDDVEYGKYFYAANGQKVIGVGNRTITIMEVEDRNTIPTTTDTTRAGDICIIVSGDNNNENYFTKTFNLGYSLTLSGDSVNTIGRFKRADDEPILWHNIETICEESDPSTEELFVWDDGIKEIDNKHIFYRLNYEGDSNEFISLTFTNRTGTSVVLKKLTVKGNIVSRYYDTWIYSQKAINQDGELKNGQWIKLTDYTVIETLVNELGGKMNLTNKQLGTLIGNDSNQSVRKIAEEVSDSAIKALIDEAPEAYDTLKEIADWIGSDEGAQTIGAAQRLRNLETWRDGDDDSEPGAEKRLSDIEDWMIGEDYSGAKDILEDIEYWKDGDEYYTGAETRLASVETKTEDIFDIIGVGLENDDKGNQRNLTDAIINIES